MRLNIPARVIGVLVAASLACGGATAPTPTSVPLATGPSADATAATEPAPSATEAGAATAAPTERAPAIASGDLTAEVTSPVSIQLNWPAAADATGYQLEAQFGVGEFMPIAALPAEALTYEHFIAPGTPGVAYRLTAQTAGGPVEVGVAPVSLPAPEANPISVTVTLVFPELNPNPPTPNPTASPFGGDPMANYILPGVTQAVGPQGGTLTFTGADGTVFTAVIPPGALEYETVLTLWPLADVTGLPFAGGLIAGVTLTPRLTFAVPIEVSIAPAAGAADRVAWRTDNISEPAPGELWLAAAPTEAGVTTLRTTEGGTLGLAAATQAEVAAQVRHLPSDDAAQMEQVIVALQWAGVTEPALTGQWLAGLTEALGAVTAPAGAARPSGLASANQSDSLAYMRGALHAAETAWRLGEFNDPANAAASAQLVTRAAAKIKEFFDKNKGLCVTPDDMIVAEIVKSLRAATTGSVWALIWQAYQQQYGAAGQQLIEDLANGDKSCTFELQVTTSTIELIGPQGLAWSWKAHSAKAWPLRLSYRNGRITLWGGGEVTYDSYKVLLPNCSPPIELGPKPTGLLVVELEPRFDKGKLLGFWVTSAAPGNPDYIIEIERVEPEAGASRCRVSDIKAIPPLPDSWSISFANFRNSPAVPPAVFRPSTGFDPTQYPQVLKWQVTENTLLDLIENSTAQLIIKRKNQ